jgi:hypothetical protein
LRPAVPSTKYLREFLKTFLNSSNAIIRGLEKTKS